MKIDRRIQKKGAEILAAVITVLAGLYCTGCSDAGTEEKNTLIIAEAEAEVPEYSLAAATVGDVFCTEHVKCTYLQVKDQEISFSVSGRRVSKVAVKEGDSVSKGQLLAELDSSQWESRIEELEYKIERNRILLEQSKLTEDYEISAKWLQYIYRSGGSKEEESNVKDSVARLQEDYQLMRREYQDVIDLDTLELEKLKEQIAIGSVYAGMDGVISWQKSNLEGSTCAKDEVVMKIIDSSECLFMVEGAEYAAWFQEGVPVDVSITSGTGAGRYQLLPYQMEEWGDQLTFSLAEEYKDSVIEVGAAGNISVVREYRSQVLTVPPRAVHKAENKYYVYVVGTDGMREVQWIETGLHGDEAVEVISGLEPGEKVIIK